MLVLLTFEIFVLLLMPDFVLQPRRLCSGTSRTDVHVIPGSDRFLLFLNGHFLQVRHFTLDVSDRLRLVDRLDMQVDGHGVV